MGNDAYTEAIPSFLRETDIGKVKAGVLDRNSGSSGIPYSFLWAMASLRFGCYFGRWVHIGFLFFTGYGYFTFSFPLYIRHLGCAIGPQDGRRQV